MGVRVTLIPGDGIGPEITASVVRILESAGAGIEWEEHLVGQGAVVRGMDPMPSSVLDSVRRNKVALKGPVTTPVGSGFRSVNVALRKELDLYACLRPVKNLPGVVTRFENVDLVIVRENTEDLYIGQERVILPGIVESSKIITEAASTRIARFAFDFAKKNGRKRVTAVHKANIMKISDGLFLECVRNVAATGFPGITADDRIVDNACLQMVIAPEKYDVLVMENLYGDILSDLAAGLVGGLGVVPGANLGTDCAVFEAVHGSAPDIAGKGLANPTALLQSAVLMLRHLGLTEAAGRVEKGLLATLARGIRTKDLGGSASTCDFTDAIVEACC
jgi:isocitrate dehydrogenase (NAD+)